MPNKTIISIIYLYAEYKKVDLIDSKQRSSFISRNLRPAKFLEGYSKERIKQVMDFLEKCDFKWSLETVGKYIDEDLAKQEENRMIMRGYFKCDKGYWHRKGEICGH